MKRLLDRLPDHKKVPSGYRASCPACKGKEVLSITEASDGTVLIKCHRYEGGCDQEAIMRSLGLAMRDLFPTREFLTPSRPTATVQPADPVTLAKYAERKRLPEQFLKNLGVEDCTWKGEKMLRILYRNHCDETIATRYRTAWQDDKKAGIRRFRWKTGDRPKPYGLWRLAEAREQGTVFVVEGESDCHTCWYHGLPALGIPGVDTFRPDWCPFFDGIDQILLFEEPDKGGESLLNRFAKSALLPRVKVLRPKGFKDPSDIHCSNPDSFLAVMEALVQRAEPLEQIVRAKNYATSLERAKGCEHIARQPDILTCLAKDLESRGCVGEDRNAKLLYLILTTRLFKAPVSASIKGPSSAGKSYGLKRVLEYFPESAYYAQTAMSEHALVYDDEPLKHRFLIIYEAPGASAEKMSYMLRTILSEGHVKYKTVEKTSEGMKPRQILKEGPTGFITTTTAHNLHQENETRMFSLSVQDTQEQTRRILDAIAEDEEDIAPMDPGWHALQEWLSSGECRVVVPFLKEVLSLIPATGLRLRRDATALKTLIKAHALLHQMNRQTDGRGRIVASLEDYNSVRSLLIDLFSEGIEAAIPPPVRDTVSAVASLLDGRPEGQTVQSKEVAKALSLDKSACSRRIGKAIELGYLHNSADKYKPMKLTLGDAMPEDFEVLPSLDRLHGCTETAEDKEQSLVQPEADEEFQEVA